MGEEIPLSDRKAVQQVLEQKRQEALLMTWVDKIEKKGKERRLLVIGTDRIFSFRPGGKLVREGHYLEVSEISSPRPGEVNLVFKQFKLPFISDQSDDIIHAIRSAFHNSITGMPEKNAYKLDVSPNSRLRDIEIPEQALDGFISTYKSLCNFHGHDVRDDICWDMENLFIPGNIKEFNLREFEQPISFNDFRALLQALQYNSWFRTLVAKEFSVDKNMTQCIAEVLKTNIKIEELVLVKLGLNKDGISLIADSLLANKLAAINTLNLSHNPLEDKGLQSLANWIGNLNRGLVKLNLNSCSGNKVGTQAICAALKKNVHMTSTLLYFDISNNKLEADGSSALASFLASPNSLKYLLLSNSNANMDILLSAIMRGCNELVKIDLSLNKFTKKELPTLQKYLTATTLLNNINISATSFPVECIKEFLESIGSNPYLKDAVIYMAENKLGIAGARVLASLADKINNVVYLDLSDNDFGDEGLGIVTEGLRYNNSLKHLSLDKNYKGKTKTKSNFMDGLISLLDSDCPLESLSIAGAPKLELKTDILPLLAVLGTNTSLKALDISGNQIGSKGASALGKMLQTNDTLSTLKWDNNGTPLAGFVSFNMGLKRNYTLKTMPVPIQDVSNALKEAHNPKSLMDIIAKMESHISRNQNPTARFQKDATQLSEGANNQFAFLSSGQREEVQKLLFKIKGTGRKVPDNKKIVVEEASNQDQVMTNLFSLKDSVATTVELELKQKLIEFVNSTYPLYSTMKEKLIEQIIDLVKSSYTCLDEEVIRRLQPNLIFGAGKDLTPEEYERALVEVAGVELSNKASQALHSVCSIASDYLYEKLQDKLRDISDELAEEINSEQKKKEAEEAAKAGPAKPKTAPPPVPTKKPAAAEKKPPPKADKGKGKTPAKEEPTVHVEALPKAESNLEHATKDRPQIQQKRKPPTRKPRPVHNPDAANKM